MSKKLTPEYVTMRTKVDRLEKLKNLNLWGCDLEDVSVIKQMPNLEVVSLSVNRIKTLKDFGILRQLKELYLRKNFIADIAEIKFLEKCPNLKVLWLSENPIADTKNYRQIVIRSLPNLTKLDDNVITADERSRADEGGDDEDDYNNYNQKKNEEVNRSYDDVDHKDDSVYEAAKIYNNKSPIGNTGNEKYGFKKSHTAYEDTVENELKSNYNFGKNNKNNNYNQQQNYDNYGNNNVKNNKDRTMANNNKYNYDNYQYEESNMVDRFENLNVGGGNNNNYGKKNDNIRRESRNNANETYNNNDYRNDYRNDNKKSRMDEYNENLKDYNNIKKRKSVDNPGRNQTTNNNRSSNVLGCVLMLLKELNDNDLEIVRDEIDQKLGNY
jgi:hypothetical protein